MAKRKTKTAQQIAEDLAARKRQDFEAVGLQGAASSLPQQEAVQVTRAGGGRDGRTVEGDSARRIDAIDAIRPLLKKQECGGCYDALRRFEYDLLVRKGEGDRGRPMERVDGQDGKDLADKIITAGENIDGIEARLSRRDWWLVNELIRPSRSHEGWKGAVFYVTGEENAHAQAAAVRGAAVNLRDAYEGLEQAQVARRKAA